jgi:hypothetical protein
LPSFDEGIWGVMVEYVTVFNKKKVIYTFKGGIEIIINSYTNNEYILGC